MRVLVMVGLFLSLAACDTSSSVSFKGDRASSPSTGSTETTQGLASTSGGFVQSTSTNGAKVSLSMGEKTNQVRGTTSQGYTVQFNVQSLISP